MPVRGDFGKLAGLSRLFAGARGTLYDDVKTVLAAEALTQLRLGFRGVRDPYGNPWLPLKYRKGKPLQDTGRLRNSFSSRVEAGGFRIGTNVVYAAPHQDGGRGGRPPRRMMLPSGSQGLGPIWNDAFRKASVAAFKKFFRG